MSEENGQVALDVIPATTKKTRATRAVTVAPVIQSQSVSPSPEALIAQAIDKGLPVETIEKFLAMRKELKAEAAKEAFDEALSAFQAECPIIEKDKSVVFNGKKQYVYAPMDSIIRQVQGLLAKHGFSYSFKIEEAETGIKAICILKHRMGHSETSDFTADMKGTSMMSNAQVTSSKATYAKRNAFCNVTGIVTGDEDNDAEKGTVEAKDEVRATQEQRDQIDSLAEQAGITKAEVANVCRQDYGVSITEITQTQALGIIDRLKLKLSKAK